MQKSHEKGPITILFILISEHIVFFIIVFTFYILTFRSIHVVYNIIVLHHSFYIISQFKYCIEELSQCCFWNANNPRTGRPVLTMVSTLR